jgi:hypothetical protein
MSDVQDACANIPQNILDLHRVFAKSVDGRVVLKIVKKTNTDECAKYEDWYEHGAPKKSKPRESKDSRSSVESLNNSDTIIEKYTNVEEFIDEVCKKGKEYSINHNILYRRYGVWCQTSKIPSVEIRSFIKTLKKLKYECKQNVWTGIGLN